MEKGQWLGVDHVTQMITLFYSRHEMFLLKCCLCALPNMERGMNAKQLHVGLICPDGIVSEVLWFEMQFCENQSYFLLFPSSFEGEVHTASSQPVLIIA